MNNELLQIDHIKTYPNPSQVPNSPGIYGWYYNFLHLIDFKTDRKKLVEEIIEISRKISYPSLFGTVEGILGTQYEAIITNIDYINPTEKKTSAIESMSEEDILSLIELLHVFASPLYIGVANKLRKRYADHINDMEAAQNSGEPSEKIEKFGNRIINEMKIEPRFLIFKCVEYPDIMRHDLEAIEYIANRLFKPIGGRR